MATKQELEARVAELEGIVTNVTQKVMQYEGCYPGRVEFLEQCGIEPPREETSWVCITVVMRLKGPDNGRYEAITDLEMHLDAIESPDWEMDSAFVMDAEYTVVDGDDPRPHGSFPSIQGVPTSGFDLNEYMELIHLEQANRN